MSSSIRIGEINTYSPSALSGFMATYKKSEDLINAFIEKLRDRRFELGIEGSFEQYLGIKFERDSHNGTIELAQKGLIRLKV